MRRGSQRGTTGRPLTKVLLLFTLGLLAILLTASVAVAFTDTAGSPYAPAINSLAGQGIVQGFGDGTFAPEAALTRAQFAKIVVLAYKLPNSDAMTTPFVDLIANESADPQWRAYIAGAYARHITLGTTATTFSPWASVPRKQPRWPPQRTRLAQHRLEPYEVTLSSVDPPLLNVSFYA